MARGTQARFSPERFSPIRSAQASSEKESRRGEEGCCTHAKSARHLRSPHIIAILVSDMLILKSFLSGVSEGGKLQRMTLPAGHSTVCASSPSYGCCPLPT